MVVFDEKGELHRKRTLWQSVKDELRNDPLVVFLFGPRKGRDDAA